MNLRPLLLCGVAAAMLSPTLAHASVIFDFSFTGTTPDTGTSTVPFSGSGVLVANEIGTTDEYKVASITGTTDGLTISKLLAVGGYDSNDNLLFYTPGGPAVLDNKGISYQLSDGVDVGIYLSTYGTDAETLFGSDGSLVSVDQSAAISVINPSVSPTPEPSSLVLLGTGILGLAGTARRLRKTQGDVAGSS